MKKLLLLDADVIIDLHALDLFEKICKSFDVYVTQAVQEEAQYFEKAGKKHRIVLPDKVKVVHEVSIESLMMVKREASEARLTIDYGESESIAYLFQSGEDLHFCSCDQAAIKLVAYMNLERKSMSLEQVFKSTGIPVKRIAVKHLENTYKNCIKDGRTLRIYFKKLT